MRMSCNGCRVLRKGCSEDCSIRPCLQWIKSPESQGNATVFLAKYYGRAGLINLINAGPDHLRPAIFRSLLYEACGRIVNPIYGAVGLLWSGSWPLCQSAVEAVLKGTPIAQIQQLDAAPAAVKAACDIRHVAREDAAAELHRIGKSRARFKRPGSALKPRPAPPPSTECAGTGDRAADDLTHEWEPNVAPVAAARVDGDSRENESVFSAEAAASSHVSHGDGGSPAPSPAEEEEEDEDELGLELKLGLEPSSRAGYGDLLQSERCECKVDLCLQLPAAAL